MGEVKDFMDTMSSLGFPVIVMDDDGVRLHKEGGTMAKTCTNPKCGRTIKRGQGFGYAPTTDVLCVPCWQAHHVLRAIQDLTEFCTSGRRYQTQNPYTIPEIKASLIAIAIAKDLPTINDAWMDANKDREGRA